jgi:hypothetical protein
MINNHRISPQIFAATQLKESLSRGCILNILDYKIVPRMCFNNATATDFEDWLNSPDRLLGAFPFFADRKDTRRLKGKQELTK